MEANLHLSYVWRDPTMGASSHTSIRWPTPMPIRRSHAFHTSIYFDLDAGYELSTGLLEGLELRVGIENLTDEEPPIFPSSFGPPSAQYDVLGRHYYASLSYSF